jgi:hypothetical protein
MACHTLRHSINFVKKIGINLAYEEGYVIGKGTEVFQFKGCKYLIDFDDSFNQRVVSSLILAAPYCKTVNGTGD